jgi:hypothetical protein
LNIPHCSDRQAGLSTIATIAAFVGLGLVFFTLVLLTSSSNNPVDQQPSSQNPTTEESTDDEPPYIRIPENSRIYQNETFAFSFAYPDSFGELVTINNGAAATSEAFRAESGLAAQKPVGNGTAIMNGRISVYVYNKDNFKLVVNNNDVSVGPVKTGNDTTWKIVSRGSSSQDISIGDAYSVKSVKSQTGVTVFDFAYTPGSNLTLGRWVFESDDRYVMVAMPAVSKIDGSNLESTDIEAYKTIGNNLAKTVRAKAAPKASADNNNSSQASEDATSPSN